MIRSAAREIAVQLGFSVVASKQPPEKVLKTFFEPEHYASLFEESDVYSEGPSAKDMEFIHDSVVGVTKHLAELDAYIDKYAKDWRTERISRSAVALMRQAMYEILYMPEVPNASSINEAVELAKGYESQEVVSFINGVLGGFYRAEVEGIPDPELEAEADDDREDGDADD